MHRNGHRMNVDYELCKGNCESEVSGCRDCVVPSEAVPTSAAMVPLAVLLFAVAKNIKRVAAAAL